MTYPVCLSGPGRGVASGDAIVVPAARVAGDVSAGQVGKERARADHRLWVRGRVRAALAAGLEAETERRTGAPPARLSITGDVDAVLGGGLRVDALHEFHAFAAVDRAGAIAFALLLAELRARRDGGAIIWAFDRRKAAGRPYGPGLAELGVDPGRVTLLPLARPRDVLRAGLDCARAGEVAAVLIDLAGAQPLLDLTATRRFQLAAEEKGASVLLLRSGGEAGPSAAVTRWRVGSAPSRVLEANAPGHPVFALDLLRQKGGREGLSIKLEWNRDTASFGPVRSTGERAAVAVPTGREAPLPGAFPAVASG